MGDIKVSQMQETTNIHNDDYVMIIQNGTNKKFRIQLILELIFPVGSTYTTQEDINPNSILGFGIWERLKGRVCIGLDENNESFNTIGQTGGEKEHTLTVKEMPKHSHTPQANVAVMAGSGSSDINQTAGGRTYEILTIGTEGGSQPHNNLQPYEVVGYMWIRRS